MKEREKEHGEQDSSFMCPYPPVCIVQIRLGFPRLDIFSNFSKPREDRLRRRGWLTLLTHFGLLNMSVTLIPPC